MENRDEPVADKVPVLRGDILHHIKCDGIVKVCRVEVNDILDPFLRNIFQYRLCEFSVRVDDGKTLPGTDILDDHILDHVGLAHAGFADHVHVAAAVVGLDAETTPLVAEIRLGEWNDVLNHRS